MRWMMVIAVYGLAGCASTSLAPSIIRLATPVSSLDPVGVNVGIRTGPRLANVQQMSASSPLGGTNSGSSFDVRNNLGIAWDVDVTIRTRSPLAFHVGAQAEFGYPIPIPGVGLFAGTSAAFTQGQLTVAPALAVRGATDFGLSGLTGVSGSVVAADASVTVSVRALDDLKFGLVPFVSIQQGFTSRSSVSMLSSTTLRPAVYLGGMLVVRVLSLELMAGFGRVFAGPQSFNVPLMGVRAVIGT